jgi:hypothetical protein
MTPARELRIGDAERENAVSALGEHYAAGRLSKEEYDERSASAWSARTTSELTPLFLDLPALAAAGPATTTRGHARVPWTGTAGGGPVHGSTGRRGWFGVPMPALPLLPVLLLVLVLVALTHLPWPLLLLVGLLWWSGGRRHRPRRRC